MKFDQEPDIRKNEGVRTPASDDGEDLLERPLAGVIPSVHLAAHEPLKPAQQTRNRNLHRISLSRIPFFSQQITF